MVDNKYCPYCAEFEGDGLEFYEKYGRSGCIGIPSASGEFPYNSKIHCFVDKPTKTYDELLQEKIEGIKKIILNNSVEKAAELISRRYK